MGSIRGVALVVVTKTPSRWLHEILSGQIDMKAAPESIQSWARFPIYQGAVEIVKMHGVDARREALAKIPAPIRPYVEAEIKRIWPLLRG